MVSYTVAMVGILIFTSMAIEALLHTTMGGPDIAWWAWALLFVAMVGVLGYLKVDVSARVLSVLLGLELLIVAIWDAAVLSSRVTAGELTFSSFDPHVARSEEHTSELQSLMRISYAVFCLKKKKHTRRV